MHSQSYLSIQARYERGESTIKKIRDAAVEEIFLNGYYGTNICKITKRAKLTRGAFYNYWASLKECLADILLQNNEDKKENDDCKQKERDSHLEEKIQNENFKSKNKKKDQLQMKLKYHNKTSLLLQEMYQDITLDSSTSLKYRYLPLILLQEKSFMDTEFSALICKSITSIRKNWSEAVAIDKCNGLIPFNTDELTVATSMLNFVSGIIQNKNHDTEKEELNAPLKKALNITVSHLFTKKYLSRYRYQKKAEQKSTTNISTKNQVIINKEQASVKSASKQRRKVISKKVV